MRDDAHGTRPRGWRGLARALRPAAPLHPIFVHFTVALTAASLAFDVLGRVLGVPSLGAAGWWALAGALPATVGAVVSGVTSRMRLPMGEGVARAWLRAHMALGPTFLGLLAAVTVWRASLWERDAPATWSYLAAMAATVLVLTAQGFIGGELVYRFGAEVRGRYPQLPNESGPRRRAPRARPA